MNRYAVQEQRNKVSRLLRTSNRNRNAMHWSKNETPEHGVTSFTQKLSLSRQDCVQML